MSAGALGTKMPERGRRVMPSHEILINAVLVAAGKLVNGSTIRHLTPIELEFNSTHYAVETDCHSIIFTERMPVETKGNIPRNKLELDNWDEYVVLNGKHGRGYPALPFFIDTIR